MKKLFKFFVFLAMVFGVASCGIVEPVGITISSANNVRIIEENKATIQSCCDALGISVSFYSSGSGGSSAPRMSGSPRSTVTYERY